MRELTQNEGNSDPAATFYRAAEVLHGRCLRLGGHPGDCRDRFRAVVDSLVAWIEEHPEQARLYWCDAIASVDPRLRVQAQRARQRLTSIILSHLPTGALTAPHEVNIEWVFGLVRQVIDEELRATPVDLRRLADRLTRLAPLLISGDH